MDKFIYGKDRLTAGLAIDIAEGKNKGILDEDSEKRIKNSFERVSKILQKDEAVYGINTGFGPLCRKKISKKDTAKLQYNLLKSHACGVGEPIDPFIAKLMMIIKIHSLALGYSGVSLETIKRIMWHIENDVIPVVPSKGSVGASGDLAPLAHLFLPLIGFGKVKKDNKVYDTKEILAKYNLKPLHLHPKEGLALINGTQFMSAHTVYGIHKFANCLDNSDIISAITIEALKASIKPFHKEPHKLRNYPGCTYAAQRVGLMLENSEIVRSHIHCNKVQDPYSLRCIPQVAGAARNAFLHLKEILEIELNSVTDNPVIINENLVISGGNFHGEPIALPVDYAKLAASELGNISDRRIYLLLGGDEEGLPKMLLKDVGINSGFMIAQYVSAALASENKTLCYPASADSIPTSLGQEDHVSMGSVAVRKFNEVLDNTETILSIELLLSLQALEFRRPLKSSEVVEKIYEYVREKIDFAKEDRIFSKDMEKAKDIVASGKLIEIFNNSINLNDKLKTKFSTY